MNRNIICMHQDDDYLVSYFVDILYSGGAIVSIAIAIATKRFVLCHFPIQTFVVHCKIQCRPKSRHVTVNEFHADTATDATTDATTTTVGKENKYV